MNDTNILYADKNLKAIEQTVNVELNNVHDWLTTNRLILNTKKIKVLNVSSSSEKKMHFSPQISILDKPKESHFRAKKVISNI